LEFANAGSWGGRKAGELEEKPLEITIILSTKF